MLSSTMKQTQSGCLIDLMNPVISEHDFLNDAPTALARIARYTGHVSYGAYSVAQHCVLGAEAILSETGDEELALYFLLHDAHEYLLGDIATPIARAIGEAASRHAGYDHFAGAVALGISDLKLQIDIQIYSALGLAYPTEEQGKAIHAMDTRMLKWERDYLLGKASNWSAEVEAAAPITLMQSLLMPWSWRKAADTWYAMLITLMKDCAHG